MELGANRIPRSTAAIPAGAGVVSLAALLTVGATQATRVKLASAAYETPTPSTPANAGASAAHRRALLKFEVARLLLCTLLLALSVVTVITGISEGEGRVLNISLVAVYVRGLATASIFD